MELFSYTDQLTPQWKPTYKSVVAEHTKMERAMCRKFSNQFLILSNFVHKADFFAFAIVYNQQEKKKRKSQA